MTCAIARQPKRIQRPKYSKCSLWLILTMTFTKYFQTLLFQQNYIIFSIVHIFTLPTRHPHIHVCSTPTLPHIYCSNSPSSAPLRRVSAPNTDIYIDISIYVRVYAHVTKMRESERKTERARQTI